MAIPAFRVDGNDMVPDHAANFDDLRGWYHAFASTDYTWRGLSNAKGPRLYYRAALKYVRRSEYAYVAVDGMGRKVRDNEPYPCTIDPASGKFLRLCVQTRDSFCSLPNSTWDRTVIRNVAPRLFRLATLPLKAVPIERRHDTTLWTTADWASVAGLWLLSSLGISILVRSYQQYLLPSSVD
jgi:hypothetical protein